MIRVNIILKTGLEQILTPNKNKNTKNKNRSNLHKPTKTPNHYT